MDSIFANVTPGITVGLVLTLFLVMWIFKNYSKLSRLYNNTKRIFKALRGVKYIQNPNAPTLSKEQYAALNICAILNEQNMYYSNCLETEPDTNDVASRLGENYGIDDRESAIETLTYFFHRGHHIYYDAIKPVISNISSEVDTSMLSDSEKEGNLETYINNLKETLEFLVSNKVIKNSSELKDISIEAWDLARVAFVARCCYDCNYITESESWEFIMAAYQKTKEIYPSWKEFTQGYIVGRCMWSGEHHYNVGILNIAEGLLNDNDSPWVKNPL